MLTPGQWATRKLALESEAGKKRLEEARLVDEVSFGEQQSETDHSLLSEHSQIGDFRDRKWRDAKDGGFVSIVLKVARDVPQVLRCTYWGDEKGARTFDILIDGKIIATQQLNRNQGSKFFDAEYPIPAELVSGKEKVTVRFQPHEKNMAGGIFNCAILKSSK